MPNTLTIIFTSKPSAEPVEFQNPNSPGVYVLGTQQANGTWQAIFTGVTKGVYGALIARLKNFPAISATIGASGTVLNIVPPAPMGTSAIGTSTGISVTASTSPNGLINRILASSSGAAGTFAQIYQGATSSYPHALAAGTTQYYQYQYVGNGGFYDDSALSLVFQGMATATVPMAVTLQASPSSTAPAGSTIVFTATVTNGTAQYVQFKDANGVMLGTVSAAPFTFSTTPQVVGSVSVRAYAVDAKAVTATSGLLTISVTTAVIVVPTLANTAGRWDATMNLPNTTSLTWAESGGNGKSLTAFGGLMDVLPTGLKGTTALRGGAGKGFNLPLINLATDNNFAFIAVVKYDDPVAVEEEGRLVVTNNYTFNEAGSFLFMAQELYVPNPLNGYQTTGYRVLNADAAGWRYLDQNITTAGQAVLSGQVQPSINRITSRFNGTEVSGTYASSLLSGRGLDMFVNFKGVVQVMHLFSGAVQQTYEDWIKYYSDRLANTVQPYTLFATGIQASKAVLRSENNSSSMFGTGTEWVVSTNAATIDVLAYQSPNPGIGVFVDDVWLKTLTTSVYETITLGSAGTTRKVRLVTTVCQGNEFNDTNIKAGSVREVRYPSTSTTGWAIQAKKTKGMVILGDSISVGAGPNIPVLNGPFQRVGIARPDIDIYYDGWGFRSWKGSLFTDGQRAVSVDRWVTALTGYTTKIAVLQLGTNDYTGQGTSDEVAAAFVAFITALRAAIPDLAKIIVITPTERMAEFPDTTVTPNIPPKDFGGGLLPTYRTKIAAAVTGMNIANLVVINGPDLLKVANLADGTHPNDLGASGYATAFLPYIQSL